MHSSPFLCRTALTLGLGLLIQHESLAQAAETAPPTAAPRPASDAAAPSAAPRPASDTAAPSKPAALDPIPFALRFDLGLGGGSVGLAARIGAEFDLWLHQHVGLGLLGGYTTQGTLWDDSYSNWFFGPVLTVRERPEGGMFASAAAGVATGNYTSSTGEIFFCQGGPCSVSHSFTGFGAVLSAGWMGRAGGVDMGGALKVDILPVDAGGQRTLVAATANFIVGVSGP